MNDALVQSTKDLSNNTFSYIGSIASIIGFLISAWVLFKIRIIESHFLFKVRFPTLKRQVGKHSATISRHLNSFPDSANEIEIELKKCQADLKNLKSKLNGSSKTSVKEILKNINKLPSPLNEYSKQSIREVHLSLVLLEQDLDNLKEDLQWRSNK